MMERIHPISRKLSGAVDVCGTVASVFLFVAALAPPAFGDAMVRVSVNTAGAQGNGTSDEASVSADGRFVAFSSAATNLVPGDTNGRKDVFVRDTCLGAPADCTPSTVRVSVAGDGTQGDYDSFSPVISANARFVAFVSEASNLVADDDDWNGAWDVFLRDTCVGGPAGCTPSTVWVVSGLDRPAISADGRFVAFTDYGADVFLQDTCLGAGAGCVPSTVRVSVASDGTELWFPYSSVHGHGQPSMSADGRFVAFASYVSLVAGEYEISDTVLIHVRDTCVGGPAGCTPSTVWVVNGGTGPAISADGRFVAFIGGSEVFLRDTCLGAPPGCTPGTIQLSVASDGSPANQPSTSPSISADGRLVAFASNATNLVPDHPGGVFVRDTCVGGPAGCTPSTVWVSAGARPAISADGSVVSFSSDASNLVVGDTNGARDVFLASTGPGVPPPPPPPNAPPVASFTLACTALTCVVDGSGSSDPNGTITSYAWTFGDETTGSGATASHTYAAAGTYTITLIVTDDDGAMSTLDQTVTVSPVFMHVGDLDRATTNQGGTWTAIVTATVDDASHGPIAGVTVSGAWNSGGTGSCATNQNGQCTMAKSGIPKNTRSVTFTVVNVTGPALTYASSANHDPDGDSTGTSITVSRP